jgi:hypothetical protein
MAPLTVTARTSTGAQGQCVHTCTYRKTSKPCIERGPILSIGGGAVKGHIRNPRIHPMCNQHCPGYKHLIQPSASTPLSDHQIIRLYFVLPPNYNLVNLCNSEDENAHLVFLKNISKDTLLGWCGAIPGLEKALSTPGDAMLQGSHKHRWLAKSGTWDISNVGIYNVVCMNS